MSFWYVAVADTRHISANRGYWFFRRLLWMRFYRG